MSCSVRVTHPRAFVELLKTVLIESALPPPTTKLGSSAAAVLPPFLTTVTIVAEAGFEQLEDKGARWQNLIPSFPWIATGWRAWGRNPRKGRDLILQPSVAEP